MDKNYEMNFFSRRNFIQKLGITGSGIALAPFFKHSSQLLLEEAIKRKAGEFVKKGDTLIELFSTREGALEHALQLANVKAPYRQEGMVLERIGNGAIELE